MIDTPIVTKEFHRMWNLLSMIAGASLIRTSQLTQARRERFTAVRERSWRFAVLILVTDGYRRA